MFPIAKVLVERPLSDLDHVLNHNYSYILVIQIVKKKNVTHTLAVVSKTEVLMLQLRSHKEVFNGGEEERKRR